MGLESLNEQLAEIRAELVFQNRRIAFRPPIEELRAGYYREMKKFIGIPNNFGGFGNADVYKKMSDRNAKSLIHVYVKAEQLFSRLQAVADGNVASSGGATDMLRAVHRRGPSARQRPDGVPRTAKRSSRHDLPTPESPMSTRMNR